MDYLQPEEIEKKLSPNTIDTDFRAELFAALLVEAGFDMEQIVMIRQGSCGGNLSKIIRSVAHRSLFSVAEAQYIEIITGKPGIYDSLPEDLFHASAFPGQTKDKERILMEIKQHREEEFFIRRLFSLFENELDRGTVEAQLLELRYDKKNKYRNYVDIFSVYWPVISSMPIRNALLFINLVPHIHLIRNSLQEIGDALSLILDAPIEVSKKTKQHGIKAGKPNRIRNMCLGVDSVNVGAFYDGESDLQIHIGELPASEVGRFLFGNPSHKILMALMDIFVEANKEVEVKISVIPSERDAQLKMMNTAYLSYLGINAYLA